MMREIILVGAVPVRFLCFGVAHAVADAISDRRAPRAVRRRQRGETSSGNLGRHDQLWRRRFHHIRLNGVQLGS